MDGVHGKKSLKDLDNFYNALLGKGLNYIMYIIRFLYVHIFNLNILEAVSSLTDDKGPAEEQIRKAVQRQKKRQFKNKSVTKTANTDSNH